MKPILMLLSLLGLALTVLPSLLVFAGRLGWAQHAQAMVIGTVLWFLCAPFWVRGRDPAA